MIAEFGRRLNLLNIRGTGQPEKIVLGNSATTRPIAGDLYAIQQLLQPVVNMTGVTEEALMKDQTITGNRDRF